MDFSTDPTKYINWDKRKKAILRLNAEGYIGHDRNIINTRPIDNCQSLKEIQVTSRSAITGNVTYW